MKKKILFRSLLGAPIGVTISLIITIIISLASGHGEYFSAPPNLITWCGGNETAAVIVQTLCSLVIGAVCAGASVIWEVEKWSMTKQTLIHFATFAVACIPWSYLLKWMPHNLYGALGYVAAFLIMYVLIWIARYFPMKAKVKKMNEQLREMNEENGKELGDRG